MRGDALAGLENVGNVRLAVLVQRRRHTEDHGLDFADAAEVRRRRKGAASRLLRDVGAVNVFDGAAAGVAVVDLGGVVIQAEDPDAGTGELQRERQADVAQADDSDIH